jgi:hypothetical protein
LPSGALFSLAPAKICAVSVNLTILVSAGQRRLAGITVVGAFGSGGGVAVVAVVVAVVAVVAVGAAGTTAGVAATGADVAAVGVAVGAATGVATGALIGTAAGAAQPSKLSTNQEPLTTENRRRITDLSYYRFSNWVKA